MWKDSSFSKLLGVELQVQQIYDLGIIIIEEGAHDWPL